MLTFEDRKQIERMWRDNHSPVQIAAALGFSQCTIYAELKRGQRSTTSGSLVLDENYRPEYSAERGEETVKSNMRNRGRRPRAEMTRGGC